MTNKQTNSDDSTDALYTTKAGMIVDPKRFQTADALLFKPLRVWTDRERASWQSLAHF
jgi:hypothetical protein